MTFVSRGLWLIGNIFLIGLIVVAAVVGIASPVSTSSSCPSKPVSPCWTKVQTGFTTCTMGTGTNVCSVTKTFSPAYSTIPFGESKWNKTQTTFPLGNSAQNPYSVSYMVTFQAYNQTPWVNMPSGGPVELNSCACQELNVPFVPSNAVNVYGQICINVIQPSQNSTAELNVQWFNGGPPWTDFLSNGAGSNRIGMIVGAGTGRVCGALNNPATDGGDPITNFPTTTYSGVSAGVGSTGLSLRIAGRYGAGDFYCTPTCVLNPNGSFACDPDNSAGLGTYVDCPIFGDIEFAWSYQITNQIVPDSCFTNIASISTTQIITKVTCSFNPTLSTVFTVDWWAAIPN